MFSKSSFAESRNRRRRTSISLCFPFCGARIEASIDLFRRPRSAALDRTIDGVAQGLQLLLALLDQAQALAHDLAGGAVAPALHQFIDERLPAISDRYVHGILRVRTDIRSCQILRNICYSGRRVQN